MERGVGMNKPREFWISRGVYDDIIDHEQYTTLADSNEYTHVIEYSAYEQLQKENEDLEIRLKRAVNAAYHALLEMSAWMGIPEKKRHGMIRELIENVKYCAENDLRQFDKGE